jgi:hypothetical protein
MAKNNAKIIDVNTLIQAGFDPKTGLPRKVADQTSSGTPDRNAIRTGIRIMDEQNAINRYVWYNCPKGLDSQMIERILYYRGQGAFFYMPVNETFYFLPYALSGTIDVYGRYTDITPVPFAGGKVDGEGKQKAWIQGLTRQCVYYPEMDYTEKAMEEKCVLLSDYSKQISQTVIPRQQLQEPIIDLMANMPCYLNTSLVNSTGIQGVVVGSPDEQQNVAVAAQQIKDAALHGEKYISMIGSPSIVDLGTNTGAAAEEFMRAMQSLDNYRLSLLGLDNGGLFQKNSHMLESEQAMNGGNVDLIFQDGLTLRQWFCTIVNSIWPIGLWCEASESATNNDKNLDGEVSDEQDGQVPADMAAAEGGEE